ncbi:MAG: hypothetical protein FH758_12540 [Firmicutes bacterium]|nr:hypothetical protein [Bacillota bacterium]
MVTLNVSWNIETVITLSLIFISLIGSYLIIRLDWKKYGLLYLIVAIIGNILCYLFVSFGFYSFPYRLFPNTFIMPVTSVSTIIPFYVLIGVRYSPKLWVYKIIFYMGFVHLGMLAETIARLNTSLIKYNFAWDTWDSYTWWWIFLLIFEYVGGLIINEELRKPISSTAFNYGKWAFFFFHFIVITTIFLAGYYLGYISR